MMQKELAEKQAKSLCEMVPSSSGTGGVELSLDHNAIALMSHHKIASKSAKYGVDFFITHVDPWHPNALDNFLKKVKESGIENYRAVLLCQCDNKHYCTIHFSKQGEDVKAFVFDSTRMSSRYAPFIRDSMSSAFPDSVTYSTDFHQQVTFLTCPIYAMYAAFHLMKMTDKDIYSLFEEQYGQRIGLVKLNDLEIPPVLFKLVETDKDKILQHAPDGPIPGTKEGFSLKKFLENIKKENPLKESWVNPTVRQKVEIWRDKHLVPMLMAYPPELQKEITDALMSFVIMPNEVSEKISVADNETENKIEKMEEESPSYEWRRKSREQELKKSLGKNNSGQTLLS